jgi:hypothetical protein
MDYSAEMVTVVTTRGEEQRTISHREKVDGEWRLIPVTRSSETIAWVIGDQRPHIFRSAEP